MSQIMTITLVLNSGIHVSTTYPWKMRMQKKLQKTDTQMQVTQTYDHDAQNTTSFICDRENYFQINF